MNHVIEPASSARSKCRACGLKILKDELRFGEKQPNPFGEGEMTLWFHPKCAAFRRPEVMLEFMAENPDFAQQNQDLKDIAEHSNGHRRRARISGVQRAPTGRARCRHCKELIEKGDWRVPLGFFEDGRFQPSGFVHVTCCKEYFETTDLMAYFTHFSPELTESEQQEIEKLLA